MLDDANCLYLLPGEVHYSENPVMVNTVLGSCISVTMFSHINKVGIICHSMLPDSAETYKMDANLMKYVDKSIVFMYEKMKLLNISPRETEVKLFGGSDMFDFKGKDMSVGTKNINTAIRVLSQYGYSIKAQDVGGQFTRKLYFSTETGIVYVRKISRLKGI